MVAGRAAAAALGDGGMGGEGRGEKQHAAGFEAGTSKAGGGKK